MNTFCTFTAFWTSAFFWCCLYIYKLSYYFTFLSFFYLNNFIISPPNISFLNVISFLILIPTPYLLWDNISISKIQKTDKNVNVDNFFAASCPASHSSASHDSHFSTIAYCYPSCISIIFYPVCLAPSSLDKQYVLT